MPVVDAAPAFAEAAARDGIELVSQPTFDWLTEAGHLGFERAAMNRRDPALRDPVTAAVPVISAIYERLGGDPVVMRALRANLFLTVDLAHEPTRTIIALDESPHFTSFRLQALELYPPDAALGFDIDDTRSIASLDPAASPPRSGARRQDQARRLR